ncbi:MAG: hypothetical protein AAF514_21150 [Verrucomicrobiota bacterium]
MAVSFDGRSPLLHFIRMDRVPPFFGLLAALGLLTLGSVSAEPLPHFSLTDKNPESVRYEQEVAPEDYRQQVSLWYFGAAT